MRAILHKLLIMSLCVAPLGAQAGDINFGVAKDKAWNVSEYQELAEQYGVAEHYSVYWNMLSPDNLKNPFDWIRDGFLRQGCKSVIVTILLDEEKEHSTDTSELSESRNSVVGNHQTIIDGRYDDSLRAFAIRAKKAIEDSGCQGTVTINPLHEGDGVWHAWGMDAEGNSAESYGLAFAHVVEIFRAEQTPVKFQFNPNRRDGKDQVMRLIDVWFPLVDPYVDQYAISSYNRCGTQPDATEYRSFWQEFGPAYNKLATYTDKPINVAEVSTSTLCRDDEAKQLWFEEMLAALHTWAPQTKKVTFYFGTIEIGDASNTVRIVWGFPTVEGKRLFRSLIERFEIVSLTELLEEEEVQKTEVAPVRTVRPRMRVVQPVVSVSVRPNIRPSVPVTQPQPQPQLSYDGSSWRWEAWANLRATVGDEPIPGYGTAGTIGQTSLRFSYLDKDTVQSGPSFLFGGVLSDECGDRYWQCQMRAEAGYIWRWRPSELGDYNRLQAGVGVGYRHYGDFGGRPERLDNGDLYGFAGLTWTAGGIIE